MIYGIWIESEIKEGAGGDALSRHPKRNAPPHSRGSGTARSEKYGNLQNAVPLRHRIPNAGKRVYSRGRQPYDP